MLPFGHGEEGIVVDNTGSRREGDSWADTRGRFLYGRVPSSEKDLVLS